MGALTEPMFDALVAAGCKACGGRALLFQSYLDVRAPLLGGDVVGNLVFVHDGEKFVDGVFEVACPDCRRVVFESGVCPRCNAAGGLRTALSTAHRHPLPTLCPSCDGEEVRFVALAPSKVVYSRGRPDKPQTSHELGDDGYHGIRVECEDCGIVAEYDAECPLCAAPGPLRARP